MGKTDPKKKESPKYYKIAVNIYDGSGMINLFAVMGGSDQEKILRKEVKDEFLEVFPESNLPSELKPAKSVKRILKLSKRHVRAIAHSLISIYGKDDTNGAGADKIQELAKAWYLWGYMRENIGPESYPEFDGDMDNEAELVSDEADAEASAIEGSAPISGQQSHQEADTAAEAKA